MIIGQSKTLGRSIRWWPIDNLQCLTHIPYTTHYLGSAIVYCSGPKRCPYQSASGSSCTLPLNALTQKLGAADMNDHKYSKLLSPYPVKLCMRTWGYTRNKPDVSLLKDVDDLLISAIDWETCFTGTECLLQALRYLGYRASVKAR